MLGQCFYIYPCSYLYRDKLTGSLIYQKWKHEEIFFKWIVVRRPKVNRKEWLSYPWIIDWSTNVITFSLIYDWYDNINFVYTGTACRIFNSSKKSLHTWLKRVRKLFEMTEWYLSNEDSFVQNRVSAR